MAVCPTEDRCAGGVGATAGTAKPGPLSCPQPSAPRDYRYFSQLRALSDAGHDGFPTAYFEIGL